MTNNPKECGLSHDLTMMLEGPMGNVYFRPMRFEKKGDIVGGHTHSFDHVTFVWRGSVQLRAWHESDAVKNDDGTLSPPPEEKIIARKYSAPARVHIKKDWCHEFTALEDNTFADCIYAVRDFNDQVTDEWNGDMQPYR